MDESLRSPEKQAENTVFTKMSSNGTTINSTKLVSDTGVLLSKRHVVWALLNLAGDPCIYNCLVGEHGKAGSDRSSVAGARCEDIAGIQECMWNKVGCVGLAKIK
jgi:hypothetical protein